LSSNLDVFECKPLQAEHATKLRAIAGYSLTLTTACDFPLNDLQTTLSAHLRIPHPPPIAESHKPDPDQNKPLFFFAALRF